MPVKIKAAVEGLALQNPPLPIAALHRQVQRIAKILGEEAPSYKVVYNIVRALPTDLLILAHNGTKAYSEAFDLVHRREASGPNAIWQADHSPLDILLVGHGGEPEKPWLTIVIDDYSRAVAGCLLSFEPPSTLHTSLGLRQGIWRKDDPAGIFVASQTFCTRTTAAISLPVIWSRVTADLRIRLVFSTPGKPRGRGRIERFFSTVDDMFLCELDGYAPPCGRVRGKPRLTLAQLDSLLRNFFLAVYHRRKCAETKTPPAERWEANGFLPRIPESLEQLDLLLIQVAKSRRVHRDGIHLHGLRYISPTLAAYVGESVTLRFDPRDMGEIRVFHGNGFVCRAVSAELAGETVPLREIMSARDRRRRELRAVIRDRQLAVETLLQIKRGELTETENAKASSPTKAAEHALKRYRNE